LKVFQLIDEFSFTEHHGPSTPRQKLVFNLNLNYHILTNSIYKFILPSTV